MNSSYDVIVIGAGISGLSLAYYCAKKGKSTLVLEKADRVGGSFHSHHIQERNGSRFWLEMGAHTCYNSYTKLLDIVEGLSIKDHLIRRNKVPFQVLVNNQVQSITSQLSFLELFLSLPNAPFTKKDGLTVEEYYSKLLGKKNYENLLCYFFNAVPSQECGDFPAEILFKRREHRRKDILKKFTFDDGIQLVTDRIASMSNIDVVTGVNISSVRQISERFTIESDEGRSVESDYLAIATPASESPGLLDETRPNLSKELEKIETATVESIGVVTLKESVPLKPFAGLIPTDEDFFSIVSRDTVIDDTYRGFCFHFKPGILSTTDKLEKIKQVLNVSEDQLLHITSKESSIPSLRRHHSQLVRRIDSLIENDKVLLTGNYFSGMAIEDCVSRSESEYMRIFGNK